MMRLPLFPLPVVLFPGGMMPLHIFEPRYRQMVARCIEGDKRFGLVYHDPDRHGPFQMEPGVIGTVAEILKFEPLPDGRSLIYVRGDERFEVDDGVESGAAYYEAVVSPYEDRVESGAGLAERRRRSGALFTRVLTEAVKYEEPLPEIPRDRDPSFFIARAIKIDPAWQQRLLEQQTESARLELIDELLSNVLDAHARGEWMPGDADEDEGF